MLKINQLDKFFGKKQVLHQISFEIKRGHIVGLIGANGAGKTTIMKAILGITAFDGDIQLDDQKITVDNHSALEHVGALIEYPGLYPYLTGREQLLLFANGPQRHERVNQTIEELHLAAYADVKTKKYSLGMLQKLGIALAFVNRPELVILDEPMNGLDPKATMALRQLIIRKRDEGTTFLISSHILSELQKVADDVIIIDQGRLIIDATMSELLKKSQTYFWIATDQDELAQKLLAEQGYVVSNEEQGLKISRSSISSINDLLKLLWRKDIVIKDIKETQGDLEKSLLDVLASTK
ncbi:ABC transporter ATP-binding protein [Lacticaseibacillus paracasei]|jgi:ABC-2 type transport system ATP-binding protein|uniref:ABC transporter ATP-binding protein n=1 Tax=Lacticaseibacillus paracasei TaxID=1597 RepID=UPI0009773365|nr:ABC transporter ATP-binding protein [Lacticaseibacillus paracasei]MCB5816000.1 ABC transporter ATP-binding protein [Lacticaseibacillus paracasei]MDK6822269.1 ABC transporter ATP-binding protein [Lacticaseibacillus paracasei]MDK7799212.1 ABC transporter ATP-binding protein [Lacticaseibacillus paracasei]RND96233.1 ABC-type transporter ATP-binding protein EcsA [Lacticaseibacillus paracasei]RNE13358.1 ABC-type transporter ATP-binding protein EcsA [Lacticaseibacillus paracasei]